MKVKKNQLKTKYKKLESTGLTHQICYMSHETKIIMKKANHGKLWSLISNKSSVEWWN